MDKLFSRCEQALTRLAIFSVVVMMCLTTLDALARYLFNNPMPGTYEITENYLTVVAVFFGMSYAYRGGAYIRVTFFADRTPPGIKTILQYFVQILSVLLSMAFVGTTALQAYRKFGSGINLGSLPIPVWPAYVVVPVGFLAMTILMILDLFRIKKGGSHLFNEDSSTV